jgi:hypothetical protein
MEGSSGKYLKFKPFTGKAEDWPEFKRRFMAFLHVEKLRKTLDKAQPAADALDRADWDTNNENIYYQLVFYTEGTPAGLVWQYEESTNGQAAWNALVNKYEQSGAIGLAALHAELNDCKLGADEDPDVFFVRFERIINRLRALGGPQSMPDKTVLSMLLSKVPRVYISTISGMRMKKDSELQLEDVKGYLRDHYVQFIQGTRKGRDDGGAKALFTQHKKGGDPKKKTNRYGNKKGTGNPKHKNLTCHGCGKTGHIRPDCPDAQGPSSNFSKTPFGDKQGPSRAPVPGTSFGGACNLCGQNGHKASECQAAKSALS